MVHLRAGAKYILPVSRCKITRTNACADPPLLLPGIDTTTRSAATGAGVGWGVAVGADVVANAGVAVGVAVGAGVNVLAANEAVTGVPTDATA